MNDLKKLKAMFVAITVIGTGFAVIAGSSIPAAMIIGMTCAATVMYMKERMARIAAEQSTEGERK